MILKFVEDDFVRFHNGGLLASLRRGAQAAACDTDRVRGHLGPFLERGEEQRSRRQSGGSDSDYCGNSQHNKPSHMRKKIKGHKTEISTQN